MMRILLATRNRGKQRELRALLATRGIEPIDLVEAGVPESPVEDDLEVFDTFEANALAKARYFYARTRQPTLADDSGLVVSALAGRPGVRSKRWSGRTDLTGQALDDANNRFLLAELSTAESVGDRHAHYVCVAAYVDGTREIVTRGEVHGSIVAEPRGAGGFGYDPYFAADDLAGRTFGEASEEEKEAASHRARAVSAILDRLAASGS